MEKIIITEEDINEMVFTSLKKILEGHGRNSNRRRQTMANNNAVLNDVKNAQADQNQPNNPANVEQKDTQNTPENGQTDTNGNEENIDQEDGGNINNGNENENGEIGNEEEGTDNEEDENEEEDDEEVNDTPKRKTFDDYMNSYQQGKDRVLYGNSKPYKLTSKNGQEIKIIKNTTYSLKSLGLGNSEDKIFVTGNNIDDKLYIKALDDGKIKVNTFKLDKEKWYEIKSNSVVNIDGRDFSLDN